MKAVSYPPLDTISLGCHSDTIAAFIWVEKSFHYGAMGNWNSDSARLVSILAGCPPITLISLETLGQDAGDQSRHLRHLDILRHGLR